MRQLACTGESDADGAGISRGTAARKLHRVASLLMSAEMWSTAPGERCASRPGTIRDMTTSIPQHPGSPARAYPGVQLGALRLDTPVMLAPMAGVTNPPFRQLCREQAEAGAASAGFMARRGRGNDAVTNDAERPRVPSASGAGTAGHTTNRGAGNEAPAGLWVCEMITSRALIERVPLTMTMIQPDPFDPVRSIQLYGVEPKVVAEGVRILVREGWADHIDLNFGCPAPKVTKKGGGAALPWKLDLFRDLVNAAVSAAQEASRDRDTPVPITVKFRICVDGDHTTFHDTARIAEDAGVAGLTLHGRTLEEHYAGHANWERIAELVEETDLPVFGNGDVFEAEDAADMMAQTGCAGIAVGRGCQGRPWLFYDLAAMLHGGTARREPTLGEVAAIIRRHAELSVAHFGNEGRAMRELRKHLVWYVKGYPVGSDTRQRLSHVSTLADLDTVLGEFDADAPYPPGARGKRSRSGGRKRAHLPEGWLDSRALSPEQREHIREAELGISGG